MSAIPSTPIASTPSRARGRLVLAVLVASLALVWPLTPATAGATVSPSSGVSSVQSVSTLQSAAKKKNPWAKHLKKARALKVKAAGSGKGYKRSLYGPAWSDKAGTFKWSNNGCDTRNDVLKRDLIKKKFKKGTKNCHVTKGVLRREPYTGKKNRPFDRSKGSTGGKALDIEHVVALSDAYRKGGRHWGPKKRAAFANDPRNLIAVDPGQNRAKGDKDASQWLPKSRHYHCRYAAKQANVKRIYKLHATRAEKNKLVGILSKCR